MQENERNRLMNAGAPSSESGRPQSGSTLGGQRHDEDEGARDQDQWNRRQRYGAFYTNATQRSQQRHSLQSRRATAREYERGGWNEGGIGSRTHGYGQGAEGFGFGTRGQGQTTHTPRFGGPGYRSREQRFPEARDAADFDRGTRAYEERYQSDRFEGDEDRFRGQSDPESGAFTHGYDSATSGRAYGRAARDEEGSGQYARGSYTRGEFDRDDTRSWRGEYGSQAVGRRGRWQRETLTAREIMTTDVKAVTPESSLVDVARIMKEEDTGIVPVVDAERKLKGVITDRDVVIRTLAEGKNPLEVRACDVMTDDVDGVTPDEPVRDVIELMGSKQVRRVPVVDRDDRLLGIISIGDIANRADYDEDLQEALEEISSKRSFWSRLWS